MDNTEILQHLLYIESKAAALIDDAQAEADSRVSDAEDQNREHYDREYVKEVETLEAAFYASIALTKENYQKQLAEYRESLKAIPPDTDAFFALAEKLLFSGRDGNA